jgi:hypothetical protein
MNSHIPFDTLSGYAEQELDAAESSRVESHIAKCQLCAKELESIKKMLACTCALRRCVIGKADGFVRATMSRIRRRKIYSIFQHYLMPVSAAAVLFLGVGIGLFDAHMAPQFSAGSFISSQGSSLPQVDFEDMVGAAVSVKEIRSVLEMNKAKITKVTDIYLEASVPFADYQKIRSTFGFTELPGFMGNGVMSLAADGNDAAVKTMKGQRQAATVKIRIRRK